MIKWWYTEAHVFRICVLPEKLNLRNYCNLLGFPGGSDGKASACNAGDPGSIHGSGRFPWRRKWQSTPALLPGKSRRRRSLIGYSPWGPKESDTTERLHFHFLFQVQGFYLYFLVQKKSQVLGGIVVAQKIMTKWTKNKSYLMTSCILYSYESNCII